jgi:uncharacterized Fe-S center protein
MPSAQVYFARLPPSSTEQEREEAMENILASRREPVPFHSKDKVAIKIHVGELKNTTHVKPGVVGKVVHWIKGKDAFPFLTETATLYKGQRSDAITHLEHAFYHGFTHERTGAPFIMADGLLGNTEIEVSIPGYIYSSVFIAREAVLADGLVAISHPTGHLQTGLGACLKNLGMGLASRVGKLRQHSTIKPQIQKSLCTFCRVCIKWCPEDAIIEQDGRAFIIAENCTGCGECLAVCNFHAVSYNFGTGSGELQKRVAEHAYGAIIGKKDKCLFINVLADMTKDCDCFSVQQPRVIDDIGILLSSDPVAVDQATLDLTKNRNADDLSKKSYPELDPEIQLAHAQLIGMGTREYTLIDI